MKRRKAEKHLSIFYFSKGGKKTKQDFYSFKFSAFDVNNELFSKLKTVIFKETIDNLFFEKINDRNRMKFAFEKTAE